MNDGPIRILLVDDSRSFRAALKRKLRSKTQVEVVAEVGEAKKTVETVARVKPDVIILDLNMPEMNGFELLDRLKHFNTPVIIVSGVPKDRSDLVNAALKRGAIGVIRKPKTAQGTKEFVDDLVNRIVSAVRVPTLEQAPDFSVTPAVSTSDRLIAIGASTGGTKALKRVLQRIEADCPPIVIAQHMMPSMLALFASQLDAACKMHVRLAKTGDVPEGGVALLAPGGHHLVLKKTAGKLVYEINQGPKLHGQRPAVDVLFHSIAIAAGGKDTIGVILTGMGRDGASGLLAMRETGSPTVVEDERDCVVFGMPGAAVEMNAAKHVKRLDDIGQFVINYRQ